MPRWNRITPALYGIVRKTSKPVIITRWDELVIPALNSEREVYDHAFRVYGLVQHYYHTAGTGLAIFKVLIENSNLLLEEQCLDAIFNVYWDAAEQRNYWVEPYTQGLVFDKMIDTWIQLNPDRVQWCTERLNLWLANAN
jgi:hypothetical protein